VGAFKQLGLMFKKFMMRMIVTLYMGLLILLFIYSFINYDGGIAICFAISTFIIVAANNLYTAIITDLKADCRSRDLKEKMGFM